IEENAERLIEEDIYKTASDTPQDKCVDLDRSDEERFHAAYLDYLASQFSALRLDGKKIVVDCANGAVGGFAPKLLTRLGADVIAINNKPDGRNINASCGSLHLESLQARAAKENANLGVAFDGDADRSLFIDERGNLVDGDATLWILARFF